MLICLINKSKRRKMEHSNGFWGEKNNIFSRLWIPSNHSLVQVGCKILKIYLLIYINKGLYTTKRAKDNQELDLLDIFKQTTKRTLLLGTDQCLKCMKRCEKKKFKDFAVHIILQIFCILFEWLEWVENEGEKKSK